MQIVLALAMSRESYERLIVQSGWGFIIQSVFFVFIPAALVGWACARALEDLPWRSLGWTAHVGWGRDLLLGVIVGAASVGAAALIAMAGGGVRIAMNDAQLWPAVFHTLANSAAIFILGSAAEEMLFRGYPLQTLMRSWPVAAALILPSVFFALVHGDNPNAVRGFTFVNTSLAGVWLALAFWRTRSLWLATGLHFGWNWMMGAWLGSPVSGITRLTPEPVLRWTDSGPAWLGGGLYGIEGGAACTVALLLSIAFVWRAPFFSATTELRQYTDEENPNPRQQPIVPRRD